MKKLITMIVAAACMLAYADRTIDELTAAIKAAGTAEARKTVYNSMTVAEWNTAIDAAIATTNKHDVAWTFVNAAMFSKNSVSEQALSQKDQALAAAGFKVTFWSAARLPACYAAWKTENASKFPKTIAFVDANNGSMTLLYSAEPRVQFNIAAEFAANNNATNMLCDPKWIYTSALQKCAKDIRKMLRRKGQSIITKDGVNPIQVEVDKLTAAINAPKMAGLGALVTDIWPDFTWSEPAWQPDSYVNEVKTKVLDGELELDDKAKTMLLYHLGVSEYNKFVNQYND